MEINAKKVYPMQRAKVKIISNSFYTPAYNKHFITDISNIHSVSQCVYICQNNEYCRTAQYNSHLSICSLYEEYSFVGSVLPSNKTGQTVISFSHCPNDSVSELMHVCYGTPLATPITIENVIRQLLLNTPSLITNGLVRSSVWSTKRVIMAPMWDWDRHSAYDINHDYVLLEEYRIVTGINLQYFDVDNNNYYSIVDGSGILYIRSGSFNRTISSMAWRRTCMSDKYLVSIPYSATNRTLYVYWKSNGSRAFTLPAPSNGVVSCLILNQTLFIAGRSSNPSIQSILLHPSSATSNYSVVVSKSECPQPINPLTVDSSGRLFIVCMNSSIASMLIFTTNGAILGRVTHPILANNQDALALKATKYRFSLALNNGSSTFIYDF